ncbi:MAG: hypothetical protein H7273_09825 [Polaromonas sp.]|nr:hypothetical protein [Polaromonas sp.]
MSNANLPSFPDFGKLVPGFDFLQNLAKQAAGSATQALPQLPNLGNWIAPTLNVEELDKRVQELKAVQFWLDQNAAALKATIQALEVQKMTLATLKGMNFNMAELANAFTLKGGEAPAASPPRAGGKSKGFAGLEIPPSIFQANKEKPDADASVKPSASQADTDAVPAAGPGLADPMQWWGALTQQFQAIAAEAMKEVAKTSALEPAKSLAAGMAKDAVKTATDMATGLAKNMAETATQTLAGGTRAAMKNALGAGWPKPDGAKAPAAAAPRKAAAKPAGKAAAKAKPAAPARKAAASAAPRKTAR